MESDQEEILRQIFTHRAMLIGYITSIVRDPGLAEEVFQDVALIALRKVADVDPDISLPCWLRKVARFQAMNAFRKAQKRPLPVGDTLLDQLDAAWDASETQDPQEVVMEMLRTCQEKLTPRSRRTMELRYAQNLSGADLAKRLGEPLNTVYVRLARIHRLLRECVDAKLNASAVGGE